jgi:alpha-galactosidase
MIRYDETRMLFHLQTNATSYVIRILKTGHAGHLHYGSRVGDDVEPLSLFAQPPLPLGGQVAYDAEDPTFSLNTTPLECSTYGKGDFRDPMLHIEFADGSRLLDLRYARHKIMEGKPEHSELPSTDGKDPSVQTLILTLADPLRRLEVDLEYAVFPESDAIVRRTVVRNLGEEECVLRKVLSAQLDFLEADFEMLSLDGAWIRERHPHATTLTYGQWKIDSKKGVSSADHNPFVGLKRAHTDEQSGECYGLALLYSGNFEATAEVSPHRLLRVMIGLNSFDFAWRLEPKATFVAPETVLTHSNHGLANLSHRFHLLINRHLIPKAWRNKERPVLLNNWEATYFDFDEAKILRLARLASRAGIELFVLDDGWFGSRSDDTRGLGDWTVNKKKLPSGLDGLAKKLRAMNLDFGIWVEPEMVNVDSDLYRAHPDWAIAEPGRSPSFGRNQLVLDLANPDVQAYLVDAMTQLFQSADIRYCKWDMNRNLTDWHSNTLDSRHQGEHAHRYVLGLYAVLDRLTKAFPTILFESCASGGNRFDMGMLAYMPQTWTSDNTDSLERLYIQYGTSFVFPPSTMGCHVSASPNAQVVRTSSIESRFNVAMFGVLGYELDLTRLSPFERAAMKEQIVFYKQHRKLLQFGTFTRVESPFHSNRCLWHVTNPDRSEALYLVYQVLSKPNGGYESFRIDMSAQSGAYRIRNRRQHHNLAMFGDLVKHALPIKLKAHSVPFALLQARYRMPVEQDDLIVDAQTLSASGFRPKMPFTGSGYNEHVRLMGDFGSRVYHIEPIGKDAP